MNGIYELTLRSPDGRERKTLAFLPTEETKRSLYEQARRRGLEVELREMKNERLRVGDGTSGIEFASASVSIGSPVRSCGTLTNN